MKRVLLMILGLGMASAASYLLLSSPPSKPRGVSGSSPAAVASGAPQHRGEIDQESRDQLLEILRASESGEDQRR